MGKTYNVVFNSDIAGSGFNGIQTFFYDWSKLEQGQYKCSFTWVSSVGANPNLNVNPAVFMDLGQSNTFVARPFNSGSFGASYMIPTYIGCLGVNNLFSQLTYAYSNLEDNPPFYLQQRPPNNLVQITIYVARGSPFPSIYNSVLIGRYTLTLHLEKMD